ncbi:hypothetical protein E2C01_101307 [Portunus trituberculatus]|uniref:Uncharacterized protein n=1 Tax=Portunus trituberculatus TaxID=210409 RepID=A0A5B7KJS8_PORTR|nr:hypothetical protein [Portunus trituberculatus]
MHGLTDPARILGVPLNPARVNHIASRMCSRSLEQTRPFLLSQYQKTAVTRLFAVTVQTLTFTIAITGPI